MPYLFFAVMVMLCILSFILCRQDILSPWFLTCTAYTLSAATLMLNYDKWGMPFQVDTMLILLAGICTFGLGEIAARSLQMRTLADPTAPDTGAAAAVKPAIRVSGVWVFIFSIVMLLTDVWSFRDTYRISLLAGNPGGYKEMLAYTRYIAMYTTVDVATPQALKQLKYFCFALAFFFIFIVLYNKFYQKEKFRMLCLLPILLYIPQMILTTGRVIFLRVMLFVILITIILLRRQLRFKSVPLKYILLSIFGAVCFIVVFRLAGTLTGKSTHFSFFDNISLYMAGSLPAFDHYLHSSPATNTGFAAETLVNFQRVLYKLGLASSYNITSLEFIRVYGMNFNTYTSLRRYLHDFGYAGVVLIQFLLGYLVTRLYMRASNNKKSFLPLIIYGIIFFPVVLQQIEDQFFVSILSAATFYELLYLALIYWMFIARAKRPANPDERINSI